MNWLGKTWYRLRGLLGWRIKGVPVKIYIETASGRRILVNDPHGLNLKDLREIDEVFRDIAHPPIASIGYGNYGGNDELA